MQQATCCHALASCRLQDSAAKAFSSQEKFLRRPDGEVQYGKAGEVIEIWQYEFIPVQLRLRVGNAVI